MLPLQLPNSSQIRSRHAFLSSYTIRITVACSTYDTIATRTSLANEANDGSTLDAAAKARLIVSKLDAATYVRFTNHILPKKTFDASLDETVKTLKELFGHNTSVFARRYTYFRTQRNDETIREFTGPVNRRHEMAEFNEGLGFI
ncbi:hypothetical protein Y032_0318g2338 [Ancylostoma ceylanicum]|uniref:DUF7083 domain-containing protein n=1 Tax=Ancylostoma ceylanicum TaxID=53326 RepID=A0A016S1D6_9BILA|nr:hypothetical protein Y032_0318g2338 [Ancylostoma ceylanicum]